MNVGVVVFPGSNCDHDCYYAFKTVLGQSTDFVWHKDSDVSKFDLLVIPGGFSYGDYLRTGAIARFSPVMEAVKKHAEKGKLVIGICNGFQILTEAGLLPGAMLRNRSLQFICKPVTLRVETVKTAFTQKLTQGSVLEIPIAHGEGNYYCDDDTYQRLADTDSVVFRYASEMGVLGDEFNPNGSRGHIAGIVNER